MDIRDELNAMLEKLKNGESGEQLPTEAEVTDSSETADTAVDSDSENTEEEKEPSADSYAEFEIEPSDEPAAEAENNDFAADNDSGSPEKKKPRRKKGLLTTLENILQEDPDRLADERAEKVEPDEESSGGGNSGKFKRRVYAALGVVFTLFAVLGFAASVRYAANLFHSFTSGEQSKSDFAEVVYPAVIMDIQAFDSVTDLANDQIISASLWAMIMSDDDMDKYEKTFDVIAVPEIDVEAYAAKIFGSDVPELTHETVGSGELKFYYNSESKCYNVPVNPVTFTYKPEIEAVSKNGSEYTVTVNYLQEIPEWMENSPDYQNEVSKTVEFTLVESDDSYLIKSMTVISVNSEL
ncbi:MAG: hypothetical protein LUG91_05705 [Ruminococcus sp.]|nr:hypothetical protein [Ruminococcus sp.]